MKLQSQHKAIFSHYIKASEIKASDKFQLSTASVEQLREFVPQGIDLYRNQDLLGVVFDAAVVNLANLNGDMMASKTALSCLNTFNHKPMNLEHIKDAIVGHITESRFTDTAFHKKLDFDDVYEYKRPFYMTLGGVVYKNANPEFAQLLCDIQNGNAKNDAIVSTSWEIGFTEYFAAVGSDVFEECELITDDAEVASLSKYMKGFGGNGRTPEGKVINRLIVGDALALGIGFTTNPAAKVSGVYAYDWQIWYQGDPASIAEEDKDAPYGYCPECGAKGVNRERRPNGDDTCEAGHTYKSKDAKKSCAENNSQKDKEKISQSNKTDVITLEGQDMDIKQLTELIEKAVANKGSKESVEAVAGVAKQIADEILVKNEEFVKAKDAAEKAQKDAEALAKAEQDKVAELEKQIKLNAEKIKTFEDEKAAALATQKFNERMASVDSEYELTDEDRKVIASRIKALSSDEDFASFSNEIKVLLAAKSKVAIKEAAEKLEKEKQAAIAAELEKRGIKNPLEDKKPEDKSLANNSNSGSDKPKSLIERFSEAFTDKTVTISI